MKRAFLLAALAASALLAETPAEIESIEKTWASAVSKMDYAVLDRMMSDGLIYVHSTGVVETKAEYFAKMKSGEQKYDAIDYSNVIVKVSGNTAVLAAQVRMRGATKGTPFDNTLRLMHTWVKGRNGWQLAGHQSSRMAQ